MEYTEFSTGPDDQGRRLDKVIRKMTGESTLSSLYALIRKGLIKVNDKKAKPEQKIQPDDVIKIATFLLENNKLNLNEQNSQERKDVNHDFSLIQTVFENQHVKIINKPYDINVHGEQGLSEIIEALYKSQVHDNSLSFTPGPMHRLDRKTTGLLAFSSSLKGAEWFTKSIAEKTIKKYYIGICHGKLQNRQEWCDYIFQEDKTSGNFHVMKIDNSNKNENNLAMTVCTPLAYGKYKYDDVTLCQFQILTGKKHQIRCQSSFHGIPVLGDTAYGEDKIRSYQDCYLHAYRLVFPLNNPLELPEQITAPINENFKKFLSDSLINWNGELIIN